MAIQCSHCGKMLPGDDARFCMNCGTLVPSHPMSPQSLSAHENTSIPPASAPSKSSPQQKPVLREQIAWQPTSQHTRSSAQDDPPSWLSQLERREHHKTPSDDSSLQPEKPLSQEQPPETSYGELSDPARTDKSLQDLSQQKPSVLWPEAIPHIPMVGPAKSGTPDRPAQKDFAEPTLQIQQSEVARGKFRREAWIHEDTQMLNTSHKPLTTSEDTIEDLPTQPVSTHLPPAPRVQERTAEDASPEIEHLDTRPMQVTPPPPTVLPPEVLQERPSQPGLLHDPEQMNVNQSVMHQHSSRVSMPGLSNPGLDPNNSLRLDSASPQPMSNVQSEILSPEPSSLTIQRSARRIPLLVVLILLCILVVGGVASWVITAQPFSVPPITQAWQTFTDDELGFSVLYPNNSWSVNVDHARSMVQLHDSTRTAQVNVTVAQASNTDLPQYLSAQAKQLVMSDAKPGSPLTFGGATWQRIQGTVQRDGVSYTSTIFATIHDNRLYTLTLLAPNYAEQEEVNFAPMRASWKFL